MQKPSLITCRISSELATKLAIKIPNKGERSAIVRELLKMYVEGRVAVRVPAKIRILS